MPKHSYADDTQIYLALSPNDYSPIDSLCQCIDEINSWMCQNFLQLNKEKTEVIAFGNKDEVLKVNAYLDSRGQTTKNQVRNLGVILETDLSFSSHVKAVTKSAYYHLKNIARIRCFVSSQDLEKHQIKSLLLSHHHSTSALVSEILMSVLQTVQKNQQTIYIWTDSAKKTALEHLQCSRQCKKTTTTIYLWTDSAKKTTTKNRHFTYGQTVQKKLHWSIYSAPDSAKKTTTIYIWTVHIYRLYRRQCAKYTYIYSVHIVYYKDTLNYQRHIIHRMGTSTLCTVSIHNVVYT